MAPRVWRRHAYTGKRTEGDPGPSHVRTHAHTHTHARPERHHKKGSGGIRMAEGLAQKTLLSGPCSLSRANPRKHPNPSPGHVPVVSCTRDLPLSERQREGGGWGDSFVRATADYKRIALQHENSRRKPKWAGKPLRGENRGEEDQDTATGREAERGPRGGAEGQVQQCPCSQKQPPWPSAMGQPPCHPSGQEGPVRS